MSIITPLTSSERNILKEASEKSQSINVLAKNFRELLIQRGCITSLTTVREFMSNENLMGAIKLNWLLGYSDKILPDNLSKGIVSDYDLMQIAPNNNDSVKTNDKNTIKELTKIRLNARKTMIRNIDTFIRNMGWIEEEEVVEPLPKKKVTSKKDEVRNKVDNLLDNSSTSSTLTGSLSSDHQVTMSKTDKESNISTRVPAYKAAPMDVTKVPARINVDVQSEVTDSMEIECKKFLKKMLTESGNVGGIIAYFDNDGDVQMNVIDANVLTRVMESMNMNIMDEDGDGSMKA